MGLPPADIKQGAGDSGRRDGLRRHGIAQQGMDGDRVVKGGCRQCALPFANHRNRKALGFDIVKAQPGQVFFDIDRGGFSAG